VNCHGVGAVVSMRWTPASPEARAAHFYEHDATKDGAYAVCLLCIEHRLDLVAVGQAEAGTGADWYVAPPEYARVDESGFPDLDVPGIHRLEVSGVNKGPVGHRLNEKREQSIRPGSCIPGLAGVVGFEYAVVRVESAAGREELP
jgi:hypothetical protein